MARPEDRAAAGGGYAEAAWALMRRRLEMAARQGASALRRHFDGGYAPDAAASVAPPAVSVVDLTVAYQRVPALESVGAEFPPGSMTAIVGPNGAGKSTLLKAIAGILRPRAGSILLAGGGPRDIAYLPQSDEVDRGFPVSVGDFVTLGRWRRYGAFRAAPAAVIGEARQALETVGLGAADDTPIAALSVGQFRRALFARLMLQQGAVLLLDEPFAAIDATTTQALLRLVKGWHEQGRTILAVLHDLDQVKRHFPRTLLLAHRVIAAGPTPEVLRAETLARAGFDIADAAAAS